MSGINGFYTLQSSENLIAKLIKMNDILSHRGPDGEGYFVDDFSSKSCYLGNDSKQETSRIKANSGMFLAHRRLSIIDLTEDGLQPFEMDGNYLVFNGEIYNYLELREELKELGHVFYTETDTEVVLAAYQVWGSECSNRFNGMWAFAIYNSNNRQLFISRDRFGIKPLYYYMDKQTFVFSSEIKGILAFGIFPVVNRTSLDNYLVYDLHDATEDTFFKGIKILKPSYSIIIDIGRNYFQTRENKYYTPNQLKSSSGEELYQSVRSTFEDSIKLCLRSDVEIGSCLSGGLDSSSIVSVAAKLHYSNNPSKPFQTYTTTHANSDIDETKYSKLVNEVTNTQGNYAAFEDVHFLKTIRHIVYHQEEPFSSFSIYASWKVMESASKDEIKVLLDGQGGDAVFLGSAFYYVSYIKFLIKKLRMRELFRLFKNINHRSKLTRMDLLKYFLYYSFSGSRKLNKKINALKFLNVDYKPTIKSPINNYVVSNGFNHLFQDNVFKRIQHLLRYADRNSMAFSIESRLPFMDYRLFEIMYNTDPSDIFKDGWLKSVLRISMNGSLPDEILYRKDKYGFYAPEEELLFKFDRSAFIHLINLPQMRLIFNNDYLLNCYNQKKNMSLLIKVLIVGIWIETFNPEL